MTNDGTLGVYIHIPFCVSRCVYCDFYACAGADEAELDRYTAALCSRIAAAQPLAAAYRTESLYIGGGTPSVLGGTRLCRILETAYSAFAPVPHAEITVEVNPDTAASGFFAALHRAGVNRVSVGVQSHDDAVLRRLGRPHTFAQAKNAVYAAQDAGIGNVSVDALIQLPGQTEDGVVFMLDALCALNPAHVSVYGLKAEPGTRLYAAVEAGCAALPGEDEAAAQYLTAVSCLADRGYAQYEISNFARADRASRHNMRYWTGGDYLGVGPSSHSLLCMQRTAEPADLAAFYRGDPPESHGEADALREYILLAPRLTAGITREGMLRRGAAPDTAARVLQTMQGLQAHGLSRPDGEDGCALTPAGFLVSNAVIGTLLDTLDNADAEKRNKTTESELL